MNKVYGDLATFLHVSLFMVMSHGVVASAQGGDSSDIPEIVVDKNLEALGLPENPN